MKISQLTPNPRNPFPFMGSEEEWMQFLHKIEQDKKFLKESPIVYDSTQENIVLGGNKRYYALHDLGYKEVPLEWLFDAKDWSDEKKRRFVYADNYNVGTANITMIQPDTAIHFGIKTKSVVKIDSKETQQKSKRQKKKYFHFAKNKIEINADEKKMITDRIDQYIKENSTTKGFIKSLIYGYYNT